MPITIFNQKIADFLGAFFLEKKAPMTPKKCPNGVILPNLVALHDKIRKCSI